MTIIDTEKTTEVVIPASRISPYLFMDETTVKLREIYSSEYGKTYEVIVRNDVKIGIVTRWERNWECRTVDDSEDDRCELFHGAYFPAYTKKNTRAYCLRWLAVKDALASVDASYMPTGAHALSRPA